MNIDIRPLVRAVLRLGAAELASEDAAFTALLQLRWPRGPECPKCGGRCARSGVRFICPRRRCRRRFTIFVGTVFESLRRPRVRAILLALRAMAVSRRGVSALELSKETGVPHTTMWRHMHRLRELLPCFSSGRRRDAAIVHVCGRRVDLEWFDDQDTAPRGTWPGWITVGETWCSKGISDPQFWPPLHGLGGRHGRLVGESFRAWLIGTFHGVRQHYLRQYAQEATARLSLKARSIVDETLSTLFRLNE